MRGLIRFLLCLLMLLPVSSVRAQNPEFVKDVQLDYQFGSSINLTAKIPEPSQFSWVHLILQPEGQASRQIEIFPSSDGSVSTHYDLSADPLRPFARVYYWFELRDIIGETFTTPSYWFDYNDNRYEWSTSDYDLFHIHWVDGADSFGQKSQEIATEGLKAATVLLPVTPDFPINIYVYSDIDALQEALILTGQPWTAGHASPDLGILLVSNGGESSELINLERQIPHELMHVLEYKLAGASYSEIPAWLTEGLATSVELYPDPDLQRILKEAHASGSLLSISELCAGFPQDAKAAQLAYAQSSSFVNYLNGRFGTDVFTKLIEKAASGQTCANAVNSAVEVPLEQLEKDWIAATFTTSTPVNFGILTVVISAGVLLAIMLILLLRKRHSAERIQHD